MVLHDTLWSGEEAPDPHSHGAVLSLSDVVQGRQGNILAHHSSAPAQLLSTDSKIRRFSNSHNTAKAAAVLPTSHFTEGSSRVISR